ARGGDPCAHRPVHPSGAQRIHELRPLDRGRNREAQDGAVVHPARGVALINGLKVLSNAASAKSFTTTSNTRHVSTCVARAPGFKSTSAPRLSNSSMSAFV